MTRATEGRYLADKSALARSHLPSVAQRLTPLYPSGRIATCPIIDLELLYSVRKGTEHSLLRRPAGTLSTGAAAGPAPARHGGHGKGVSQLRRLDKRVSSEHIAHAIDRGEARREIVQRSLGSHGSRIVR